MEEVFGFIWVQGVDVWIGYTRFRDFTTIHFVEIGKDYRRSITIPYITELIYIER